MVMDNGNQFQNIVSKMRPGDMDVNQKFGMIITAPYGSLIVLRENLEKDYPGCVYCTISNMPLYLVHWNDLTEKKQSDIEGRRKT
jgi:hypothetical protein